MDIVVNQLKQKPHNIPQYEGSDQVPVDDVTKTSYASVPPCEWKTHFIKYLICLLILHIIQSKIMFLVWMMPEWFTVPTRLFDQSPQIEAVLAHDKSQQNIIKLNFNLANKKKAKLDLYVPICAVQTAVKELETEETLKSVFSCFLC